MELTAPRPVRSNGRDAFIWATTIAGMAHRIAWSQDDKKIRISWEDGNGWSRFVTLGPQWSPRPDLFAAQDAVENWVDHRAQKLRPKSVS